MRSETGCATDLTPYEVRRVRIVQDLDILIRMGALVDVCVVTSRAVSKNGGSVEPSDNPGHEHLSDANKGTAKPSRKAPQGEGFRPERMHIDNPSAVCKAVMGGIQPDALVSAVREATRDIRAFLSDGVAARHLAELGTSAARFAELQSSVSSSLLLTGAMSDLKAPEIAGLAEFVATNERATELMKSISATSVPSAFSALEGAAALSLSSEAALGGFGAASAAADHLATSHRYLAEPLGLIHRPPPQPQIVRPSDHLPLVFRPGTVCTVCGKALDYEACVIEEGAWVCQTCPADFRPAITLAYSDAVGRPAGPRLITDHEGRLEGACRAYGGEFPEGWDFESYRRTHSSNAWPCDKCDGAFVRSSGTFAFGRWLCEPCALGDFRERRHTALSNIDHRSANHSAHRRSPSVFETADAVSSLLRVLDSCAACKKYAHAIARSQAQDLIAVAVELRISVSTLKRERARHAEQTKGEHLWATPRAIRRAGRFHSLI